jgi:uncharacterized Zn-binding protein involved in type VI secretion
VSGERVRTKSGTPVASDFADSIGTPIVVDESTGNCYVLVGSTITLIGGPNAVLTPTTLSASSDVSGGKIYIVTANSVTATLPASPTHGDNMFFVSHTATVTGFTVARNGNTIMALAENLSADSSMHFAFGLIYNSATTDWRLL